MKKHLAFCNSEPVQLHFSLFKQKCAIKFYNVTVYFTVNKPAGVPLSLQPVSVSISGLSLPPVSSHLFPFQHRLHQMT